MSAPARLSVAVTAQHVVVSSWSTSEPSVLAAATAAAARGENLERWLAAVVLAGTAAVTAAGAGTDLARVDAALARLDREVESSLRGMMARLDASLAKATDPVTGDVARAAQAAVDRLASGVQRVLTGSDALLPEASAKAVNRVTEQALAEIHRLLDGDRKELGALIAADRERTAVELARSIGDQNAHLAEVVAQLRESLAVHAVAAAQASSGPRKGHVYESAAHALVHEVAAAAGDGGAESVGAIAGADGSRKGDVVVELRSVPTQPRLVVEAKNRPGKAALTVRDWASELAGALTARNADVALGLCPPDQMPGCQAVLVLDSRRVVVAWHPDGPADLVTAAYLLMRMVASQQRRDAGVSAAELEDHVRAIAAGMAPLDEIQRQAVACRRAADKIGDTAKALRTDLAARIAAVQDRLADAA